jgi:hypothetical protein
MDETLKLMITFGIPSIAAIAMAWAGFRHKQSALEAQTKTDRKAFQEFRDADGLRWSTLSGQLAGALEQQSKAVHSMLKFEERRGVQIDGNTSRSRQNSHRITGLEEHDVLDRRDRLRRAGVDDDTINLTTPFATGSYPIVRDPSAGTHKTVKP